VCQHDYDSRRSDAFFPGAAPTDLYAHDLECIGAAADRLNREAEEVLEYQADDEVLKAES
jgi:hypothetical protein